MVTDLRAAFGFLTRLPVGFVELDAPRFARAAIWFPVVGLVVGAIAAGVHSLALQAGIAGAPAALIATLAAMLVTGGFHEDGLADVADGFGAHVPRERRLEIMRDSRVGTFGALAAATCVVAPVVTLAPLDGKQFATAAIAGHVLGRWSSLPQAWLLPPAEPGSKAALLRVGPIAVAVSTLLALGIVLLTGAGVVEVATAAAVTTLGSAGVMRVLKGISGDTLGAVNKLVELAVYVASSSAAS